MLSFTGLHSVRRALAVVMLVALVGAASPLASAATVSLNYSYVPGSGVTGQPAASGSTQIGTTGGPFIATVGAGSQIGIYSAGQKFATFCIEVNEHFSPGSTSYTAIVSDKSVFGTNSVLQNKVDPGPPDNVMLSPQVAYLYSNYMANTMSSVIAGWGGNSDQNSAQSLQNAIWYFMGYQKADGGTLWVDGKAHTSVATGGVFTSYVNGDHSLTAALETAANNAINGGSWVGLGNVRVMQMWIPGKEYTSDGKAQDQLVLVPLPPAIWAGLSLLGLMGVKGYRRQRLIKAGE